MIALARQIGVLHERIAPVGALKIDSGPGVGDKAPALGACDDRRRASCRSGRRWRRAARSCCCSLVARLSRSAKSSFRLQSPSPQDERLSVVYVSDGRTEELRRFVGSA